MSQGPGEDLGDKHAQIWGQEAHDSDATYQAWLRARHERSISITPHSSYHSSSNSQSTHVQFDGENSAHHPWQNYPGGTPNVYYSRDSAAHVSHHSPQHAIHSQLHERHHGHENSPPKVNRAGAASDQAYPQAQCPLPVARPQDEQYPVALQLPPPSLSVPPSQAVLVHGRDRVVVAPSGSMQISGPYTSAVLGSSGGRSVAVVPNAENPVSSRNRLSHPLSSQPSSTHIPRTTKPSTHSVEPPQFVVPSSRIPRTETLYNPAMQTPVSQSLSSVDVSTETKPKRRRANATQLRLLNETYLRTMFPTTEERAEIARRVNMTPRQVQIWFQNRRQAARQNQAPDLLISPEIHTLGLPSSESSGLHYEGSSSHQRGSGASYDFENEDS